MANINIYGVLHAATAEGIIAKAAQIKDDALDMMQSEINALVVGTGGEPGSSLPDQIQDLQDQLQEHLDQKNQPNGWAGLDENGKIDPSLVDGVVGHVLGLEQFVTNAELPTADATSFGKYYFVTDENKIAECISDGAESPVYSWEKTDPQSQVLYNRRGADENSHTNTLYRWDGSAMVAVSDPIAIGTVTGTAYDGAQGQLNRDALTSLPSKIITGLTSVTPADSSVAIALSAHDKGENNAYAAGVDVTVTIPAATTTTAGVMSKDDKANFDVLVKIANGGVDPTPGTPIDPTQVDYLLKSDSGVGIIKDFAVAEENGAIASGDTIATIFGKIVNTLDALTGGTNGALPEDGGITGSIQDAIDELKATIDAYTVNGKAINTNPVLNGADIALTGYVAAVANAEAGAVVETDTVNASMGKIEARLMAIEAAFAWYEGN